MRRNGFWSMGDGSPERKWDRRGRMGKWRGDEKRTDTKKRLVGKDESLFCWARNVSWLFYQAESGQVSQHFGRVLIALLCHIGEVAGDGFLDNLIRSLGFARFRKHEGEIPNC